MYKEIVMLYVKHISWHNSFIFVLFCFTGFFLTKTYVHVLCL